MVIPVSLQRKSDLARLGLSKALCRHVDRISRQSPSGMPGPGGVNDHRIPYPRSGPIHQSRVTFRCQYRDQYAERQELLTAFDDVEHYIGPTLRRWYRIRFPSADASEALYGQRGWSTVSESGGGGGGGRPPTGRRAQTVAQHYCSARSVGVRGGHEGPEAPGPHLPLTSRTLSERSSRHHGGGYGRCRPQPVIFLLIKTPKRPETAPTL